MLWRGLGGNRCAVLVCVVYLPVLVHGVTGVCRDVDSLGCCILDLLFGIAG